MIHSLYFVDLHISPCFNLLLQQLVLFRDIMGIPWCTMSSGTSFDPFILPSNAKCLSSKCPLLTNHNSSFSFIVTVAKIPSLGSYKLPSIHNNKSSKNNFKALLEHFFLAMTLIGKFSVLNEIEVCLNIFQEKSSVLWPFSK